MARHRFVVEPSRTKIVRLGILPSRQVGRYRLWLTRRVALNTAEVSV
jgi:hypothetical protein